MRKRLLASLLCLCMVVTLLPTIAFAATEEAAIQLGAGGIAKGNTVYYGNYAQSDTTGVAKDPIKWQVLSTTPNGTKADGEAWSAGDGWLLLSDQNLDVQPYHVDYESVTWVKSTLRSWMNGYAASENIGGSSGTDYTSNNFINTAFSESERAEILQTKLENANYNSMAGGNATTDKVFALSDTEAITTDYFAEDNSRVGMDTAYVASKRSMSAVKAYTWWLRPDGTDSTGATIVHENGGFGVGYNVNSTGVAVRPAFNLDLNSALFTSAAVGGKSSGTVGAAALNSVAGAAAATEWKLTLKDYDDDASTTLGHDGFAARLNSASSATVAAGGSVSVDYSGAATGDNEYISAMLVDDSGTVLYYGNIVKNSTSGTAQAITIPAGIAEGRYTLKVFSEQCNGNNQTDYASAFSNIAITVDNTAPIFTTVAVSRTSDTAATVKFTSNEAGEYYYAVVDSGAGAPTINTIESGTACDTTEQTITLDSLTTTGPKDIYIVVKDAAGNMSTTLKITIPAYAPIDTTAPKVTAGAVSRTSDTAATVKFTSDKAGEYYYAVVDSGAGAPMIDTAEQTITLGSLTTGAKDIYIVVKDAAGNVSTTTFKINIPAYAPIDTTPPTVTDPIQYAILNGKNSEWTKSSGNGFGITVDAYYSKYTNISVDGVTLSSDMYTAQSGSTIITLKASYLKTLSVGQHTLRVNFTDGYAETNFTIKAAASLDIPATGDSAQTVLWLGIALLAGIGLVLLMFLSPYTYVALRDRPVTAETDGLKRN